MLRAERKDLGPTSVGVGVGGGRPNVALGAGQRPGRQKHRTVARSGNSSQNQVRLTEGQESLVSCRSLRSALEER